MSPNPELPGYPFPNLGHYDSEGKHLPEYKALDRLKKKEYQDLCKKYRLAYSYGNIADLRQRLLDFSKDRDSWAALAPGAVRGHLGPRVGSKTKKKSTIRWEAKDRGSVPAVPGSIVQKGMNPLEWADMVCSTLHDEGESRNVSAPSRPCTPTDIVTLSHSASPSSSTRPFAYAPSGAAPQPSLTPTDVGRPLELAVPSQSLVPRHADTHDSPTPLLQPAVPLSAAQPAGNCDTVTSGTSPCSSSPLRSRLPGPDRRTVYLKAGPLVFTEGDVPDPPAFNDQLRGPIDQVLANVLKWWDDTRPEWDPHCSLLKMRINGEKFSIPGVLWKELYASPWKVHQWEGLKGRYSELSCLMREYDHLTAEGRIDDFWAPMKTRDKAGKCKAMRYTKAIAALRAQRKQSLQQQAEELVRDASFGQYFSYSRGGKAVGMKDATAIVKRAKKFGILA